MEKKNILKNSVLYVSLLAFIAFVVYVLCVNSEVLYTAHDRSEFLYGAPFFDTLMSKPFGIMQYVGAWLTQLFYYPALGAGVLTAVWLLIFAVGVKAFRLKGNAMALMLLPIACLLTAIVDLGYWIYVVPAKGYWFSQSVGYLVMLLLYWGASSTPRKWVVVWYIAGFLLYPFLGWFALLFILTIVLDGKLSWSNAVGAVLLLAAAPVWRAVLYSGLRLDEVIMAGFPYMKNLTDNSPNLTIPFWALGIITVFIPSAVRYCSKFFVPLICSAAGIVFTILLMYNDKTYIDEMRMVRYAENDNWKEVLNIAAETPKPTTTMVMLKNVALIHDGGLLDRSFKIGNNISYPTYNPDSVHVSLLEIASPLIYYNYGMQNEAIRLSYECAVQGGFSPFYMKMLARSTKATEEDRLMKRFTNVLHKNLFYDNWQPAEVSAKIKELQNSYPDEISGVENSENYLVNGVSLWFMTDSKLASEQALLYSMIRRDSRRFWPSLRKFLKLHQGEMFPIHAQEAYIMYMDKAPEEKRMMVQVSQEIYDRYKKFWEVLETQIRSGASKDDVVESMREEFGDTYWYYNIFAKKIY